MSHSQPIVRITESRVIGVRLYSLRTVIDAKRGNLAVCEFGPELPFTPKRYYLTYDIPSETTRGEHAHRQCHQFLTSVRGHCSVIVDDGDDREEFLLDDPTIALYIPPMVWVTACKHSHDSALMVFASHHYDDADHIRSYDEFLRLKR